MTGSVQAFLKVLKRYRRVLFVGLANSFVVSPTDFKNLRRILFLVSLAG